MAECNDLRILEKISAEVDEAQVKIILSSQCIKAQIFLVDRLRKEAAKQKEACKYISSGNCKLEAEIKHAEQELKSLMAAHDTIRSARIEIKKELLLSRERKADTAKRVELGEKKYEELWTQCKKRYESIPFVRKWFELTNKTQELKDRVETLDQEAVAVVQEIRKKKEAMQQLDNTRIIELAKYIIHDRPNMTEELTQKTETCRKLTAEIAQFLKEEEAKAKALLKHKETSEQPSNTKILLDGYWPSLREHFSGDKDSLQVPKLLMPAKDLDIFTANLEQIKRHANTPTKSDIFKTLQKDTKSPNSAANRDDIYGTSFFNKSYLNTNEAEHETGTETEPKNIAKRRLVNMLEDLNIKKGKTKNDANVNPTVMQVDNVIQKRYTITTSGEMSKSQGVPKQNDDVMEHEEIEEIDMTPSSASNAILDPPTPFLDMTQITNYGGLQEVIVHKTTDDAATISKKLKGSQESNDKKRVSFDLPVIQEVPEEVASAEADEDKAVDEANVSSYSLSASDESFNKMKEMILKKNYLDLSPDFVYAKQQAKDTRVVTSKFFKSDTLKSVTDKHQPEHQDKNMEVDKPDNDDDNSFGNKNEGKLEEQLTAATPINNYDDVIDCSKNDETKKSDNFVTGLLFNHGPNGIPESLEVSMNTTGFDDGDGDFAHGIDSSLLLSPKADIPAAISGETSEVFSQEVPNFLSGLRKTGFSFFGASASTDAKPDSAATSQGNNFNFNFGSDNKKSRGGLFSMFQ